MLRQPFDRNSSLAINWFALSFNAKECTVRVANYGLDAEIPRAIRQLDHRTVIARLTDRVAIYHVGLGAPPTLESEKVVITEPGSRVARHLLEMSFADACGRAGFLVTFHRVGGDAYRDTTMSSLPAIYAIREGFSFRAFNFLDRDFNELRWGLVLNFQTGQRFQITLSDPDLRRLALNRRVFRVVGEEGEVEDTGLLSEVGDEYVVVAHTDGSATKEDPAQWTPQCRKDLLLEYLSFVHGSSVASEASNALNRASMSLTNKRINIALARDQIARIQSLIRESGLDNFRIVSVDTGPLARLSLDPLVVGA